MIKCQITFRFVLSCNKTMEVTHIGEGANNNEAEHDAWSNMIEHVNNREPLLLTKQVIQLHKLFLL